MPPRFAVEKLPAEQFDFVIRAITNGGTDTSIPRDFEAKFGAKLAKSSLARWRKVTGNELAERYRFIHAQANVIVENLKAEGTDKHGLVIDMLEDWMLGSAKELINADPLKILGIQQKERDRGLKLRELELKERAQAFQEEQARKADQLQHDRLKIGADTWQFILSFLLSKEPTAADLLTKHSEEIVNGLEAYLENQTA